MRVERSVDQMSDYERAVCYYTLPKVVSPLTLGLVVAYSICVFEAIAALGYGLWVDSRTWTMAGAASFAGIVVFGMFAFTIRALINDLNRRTALNAARNAPVTEADSDIPDPFASHALMSHPLNVQSEVFACVTKLGAIEYYVEIKRPGLHWRVSTAQDEPAFEVVALQKMSHWMFSAPLPARLAAYADSRMIASIVRRITLRANLVNVFCVKPCERMYEIKNGCIYASGRLVGRIYTLRRNVYLDVEREHLAPGIVAHFVTLK